MISIAAIGLIAVVLAASRRVLRGGRLESIVSSGADSVGQTTLRLSILLLLGLLVLAGEFGLDVVLGAFLAGAVLRRWAPGDTHALEGKLNAVGHGFFIPVFFVSAGMAVDVDSIIESPARLLVFLALLLSVRGLSALVIYRKDLAMRERVQLMLCTATSLPLIVALTQIGLASDTMLPENAAALVGAGVLSVLLFPLTAVLLKRPDSSGSPASDATRGVLTSGRRTRYEEVSTACSARQRCPCRAAVSPGPPRADPGRLLSSVRGRRSVRQLEHMHQAHAWSGTPADGLGGVLSHCMPGQVEGPLNQL